MKNILTVSILVISFAFAVSAQTNQNSSCPTVDVSGGFVSSIDRLAFTASIENYDLIKLFIRWTMSGGKILEGQGTSTIRVLNNNNGENLIATVEVIGLPEGCPATFSLVQGPPCRVIARLSDEFSLPSLQIDKRKLNDFIERLQYEPNAQGFIIEYFRRNTPQRIINQKIQKITDYLVNEKKLEKERFTILTNLDSDKNLTKIWIVPPGAEDPTP